MATRKTRSSTQRGTFVKAAPESEQRPASLATRRRVKRTSPELNMPSPEHIRVRAYYLYLERNGCGGDPLVDWLRAERELTPAAG